MTCFSRIRFRSLSTFFKKYFAFFTFLLLPPPSPGLVCWWELCKGARLTSSSRPPIPSVSEFGVLGTVDEVHPVPDMSGVVALRMIQPLPSLLPCVWFGKSSVKSEDGLTGILILFKAKNSFSVRRLLTRFNSATWTLYFNEIDVKDSPGWMST